MQLVSLFRLPVNLYNYCDFWLYTLNLIKEKPIKDFQKTKANDTPDVTLW